MGRYKIGIEDEFEALHFLTGDFGQETQLHGHRYRVRVTLEGAELDEAGTLFDIAKLKEGLQTILNGLHRHTLNELPGLTDANPTVEHVSRYIHARLTAVLEPTIEWKRITGLDVTVWESATDFGSYRC